MSRGCQISKESKTPYLKLQHHLLNEENEEESEDHDELGHWVVDIDVIILLDLLQDLLNLFLDFGKQV